MKVTVGQLREWRSIPDTIAGRHRANGLRFRVESLGSVYVRGIYEPRRPAEFTSATPEFMEAHSVVIDEAPSATSQTAGKGAGSRGR